MADLKLMFVAVAATLLMCQMAAARPETTESDGLSLKNVEASVSIAVDDVKKNFNDMASKAEKVLQDIRKAAESADTQNMLNSWNEQLAKLAENVKATASDLSARIQSNLPTVAPPAKA